MSAARILGASLLAAVVLACEPAAETGTEAEGGAAISAARADHADGGDGGGARKSSGPKKDKGGNCYTCHMEEYEHVRHPPHVDVKPTTCAVCHVQDDWRPDVLQHDFWPLTGAHKGRPDTQCAWCHKGKPWVFDGTPKKCVGCHQEDYDASKFPEHSTFPTTCGDCHSTDAWKPATHPPKAPPPVAIPTTSASSKGTPPPKGTKSVPPTRPTATTPPIPVPIPRPTALPTTRPPDVITRPSRR